MTADVPLRPPLAQNVTTCRAIAAIVPPGRPDVERMLIGCYTAKPAGSVSAGDGRYAELLSATFGWVEKVRTEFLSLRHTLRAPPFAVLRRNSRNPIN